MSATFQYSIIRLFMATNDNFGPIKQKIGLQLLKYVDNIYSRFYNVQVSVLCVRVCYGLWWCCNHQKRERRTEVILGSIDTAIKWTANTFVTCLIFQTQADEDLTIRAKSMQPFPFFHASHNKCIVCCKS